MFRKITSLLTGAALALLLCVSIAPPAEAGASSAYLIGKLYGNVFQNAAYTPPATVYVALGTGSFSAQSCTSEVTTSGTNYARVAVTANTTNWVTNNPSGSISNGRSDCEPASSGSGKQSRLPVERVNEGYLPPGGHGSNANVGGARSLFSIFVICGLLGFVGVFAYKASGAGAGRLRSSPTEVLSLIRHLWNGASPQRNSPLFSRSWRKRLG